VASPTTPPSTRRAQLATALAWRPDWPVALLAAAAWSLLVWLQLSGWGDGGGGRGTAAPGAHLGHAHHELGATAGVSAAAVAGAVGGWVLMSTAMMAPATLPAVRYVGLNSIRRRRARAMALYVTAYLVVWTAFGAVALALVALAAEAGASERTVAAAALAVAAGWQLTRAKRRALIACGRTVPLPPEGGRADAACLRFGTRQAARCIVSCWPLMLVMAAVGHGNLLAMAALTALVVGEERSAWGRRLRAPLAVVLGAAAVAASEPLSL